MEAENTKVIIVAYEYTYQDHEYIIRTMNTKHEWCGMAFLLQAAHKIAVSFPKTFIVYCSLQVGCHSPREIVCGLNLISGRASTGRASTGRASTGRASTGRASKYNARTLV